MTKRFGGVAALDGCSISVTPGTITALIGPNGSGKTTLFNLITGYLPADAARWRWKAADQAAGAGAPLPDGAVPHLPAGPGVRKPDPGREHDRGRPPALELPAAHARAAADRSRALEILDDFGLARLAGARARQLSFGQRKLLEFATVLMGRPRIILLDEPTSGVNPVMIGVMERHIRALHEQGMTFLIVEHDMQVVMRLCDPVIVLDHGSKIMEGAPAAVQRDPAVLDAYLGTEPVLKLSGVCAGYGGGADILRGVDLELSPGSITCVVGPNGAGKSTVLKVVSGLLRPRAGSISLGEVQIGGASPRQILQRGVVHVPQERSLFPGMTVWDNLLMGAYIVDDRAEVGRRAAAIAERFPSVRERAGERAGSLSGGQQKIVEIARALMLEPKGDPARRAVDRARPQGAAHGVRDDLGAEQ